MNILELDVMHGTLIIHYYYFSINLLFFLTGIEYLKLSYLYLYSFLQDKNIIL